MATSPHLKPALELLDTLQDRPNKTQALLRHIAIHNPAAVIRAEKALFKSRIQIIGYTTDKKITILKALREAIPMNLGTAMEMLDSRIPFPELSRREAESVAESLRAAGAIVRIS